jgi:hypothetical protein
MVTFKKKSVIFYFIVYFVILTTVLVLSMAIIYIQSKKSFLEEGQERAQAVIHSFEALINGGHLNNGNNDFNTMIQSDLVELKNNLPDLEDFTIYKIAEKKAIASSTPQQINKEADPEDLQAAQMDKTVTIIDNEKGNTIVDVTAPLHINNRIDYVCGVQFSINSAMWKINSLLIILVISGLICLIISALLSLVITRNIIKPINKIIDNLGENSNQIIAASAQFSATAQQLSQGSAALSWEKDRSCICTSRK